MIMYNRHVTDKKWIWKIHFLLNKEIFGARAFSSVVKKDESLSKYYKPSSGGATIKYLVRAFSSVGRAPPLQGGCREFEPLNAHHL